MVENFPGPMAGKTALVTGGTGGHRGPCPGRRPWLIWNHGLLRSALCL